MPGRNLDGEDPTLEAMAGFFLSIRPGTDSMYVNISNATSPFIKPMTVQEFVERCTRTHDRTENEVARALKGIKVKIMYNVNHNGAVFPLPSSRYRFITSMVDNARDAPTKPATYSQTRNAGEWYGQQSPHYARQDFPNPPVRLFEGMYYVNVGKKPKTNHGNDVEWYPATALQIQAFQPFSGVLTSSQTSAMIRVALKAPRDHQRDILGTGNGSGLDHFAFANDPARRQQGGLGRPNMTAGTRFIQIPGRWLRPPQLRYSVPQSIDPTGASWDLRNVKFISPGSLRRAQYIPVLNLSGSPLPQFFERNLRTQFYGHNLVANVGIRVLIKSVTIQQTELTPLWENDF